MKKFTNESKEEGARPALGRRSQSDAAQTGSYHPVEGPGVAARTPLLNGLISNGHRIAQRSLIQLQQNCGNQCAQRAVKLAQKSEDEMMQTKSLGNQVHRQAEEEPEEEAIQTKQATSEIQRQSEEEEETTPV